LQLRALLTDALDADNLLDDDDDEEEEEAQNLNLKAVLQDYSNDGDDARFVFLFCFISVLS